MEQHVNSLMFLISSHETEVEAPKYILFDVFISCPEVEIQIKSSKFAWNSFPHCNVHCSDVAPNGVKS